MVVITTKKEMPELLNIMNGIHKVIIISCGTCAALCQTGGSEGLKEWTKDFEEEGFEVISGIVVEEVCDNRNMKKELRKMDGIIDESDAILTASCGLGAQSIVTMLNDKHPNKQVIVLNNTEFMGMTERIGRFYMRCQGCGDCLLNETGGICPISTCAKALMNGPCGGKFLIFQS